MADKLPYWVKYSDKQWPGDGMAGNNVTCPACDHHRTSKEHRSKAATCSRINQVKFKELRK